MAEATTRVFAEEDVHELMLRAYAAGWVGHEGNIERQTPLPDPERDDSTATFACEHLRADYTPRQPITEELFARSFVEKLIARSFTEAGWDMGEFGTGMSDYVGGLIARERADRG